MEIFGVFVHWKRTSADSKSYPEAADVLAVNDQSPQVLQDWKAVWSALGDTVNKSDAFLFYHRLNLANGDVLTMTYYTSKDNFVALEAANKAAFDAVHEKRAALAEELGLEVTEKQTVFTMDQFDYDDAASSMEFFNALP